MITSHDIISKNGIYFEKIQEGFDTYKHETKKLSMEQAEELFLTLWKQYGSENMFVDFYYFALEEEARERIDTLLSKEEKEYVKQMPHEKGNVIKLR